MNAQTYVRFEHYSEDRISDTFGPFEWAQIRYGELVVSPEGEPLAATDSNGDWRTVEEPGVKWSDVIIYGGTDGKSLS